MSRKTRPNLVAMLPRALLLTSSSNDLFVSEGTRISHYPVSCEPAAGVCAAQDTFGSGELSGDVAGVGVDSSNDNVYVVDAAAEKVHVFDPAVIGSALIDAQSISKVESSEAIVNAKIDAKGEPTTYRVEYGTSNAYGSSTPSISIGASSGDVNVAAHLIELQPDTEYHFRFVASDAFGSIVGADMTFTTPLLVPSSSLLPDNREFELVSTSPANQDMYDPQNGEDTADNYEDVGTSSPSRAAANGDSVTYLGEPPAEGGDGTIGPTLGNQYLATRGATGWAVSDITPEGSNANEFYEDFSGDLSIGLFFAERPIPSASPVGPERCRQLYTRTASDGGYHALFTTTQTPGECGEPYAVGISANGDHALIQTNAALTTGSVSGLDGPGNNFFESGSNNIYDSVDGRLVQVNILPNGQAEPVPGASVGSYLAIPGEGNKTRELPDFSNAISSNGSRIFWSNYEVTYSSSKETLFTPKALYVRENDTQSQSPIGPKGECIVSGDACTVQIDAGEPQCVAEAKCGGGGGRFWTASADGSRVFFTDCVKLTSNSTANSSGGCQSKEEEAESQPTGNDLYEYDVVSRRLTDLTVDSKPGDPLGADVQGVTGASEDGSYVYFVANGLLARGAIDGGHNLYVLHDGVTQLIGTLSSADNEINRIFGNTARRGDWRGALSERTAEVTPDGHDLAFMSAQPLTGYDNGGQKEAFVYDALTGKISCASCDPSGLATSGNSLGIGNYLPTSVHPGFMDRFISDDGNRVFFETREALVPQDVNGLQDVYEWERNGAGSCQAVLPGQPEHGCLYILSGGESSDSAFFIDADASGENVFFTSRGKLNPQAHDENVAVYDARVNGGFDIPSLACTGSGCQGVPPAPPIFATPSSATFNGVGNFSPPARSVARSKPKSKAVLCKRGVAKKRSKCARKKQSRKTKRSSTNSEKGRKR